MFRFLVQWILTQRLDDDRRPGFLLSWILRRDAALRRYYTDLLDLKRRLKHDAAELLAEPSVARRRNLAVLGRCWKPDPRRRTRRSFGRALRVAALTLAIFFGAGFLVNFCLPRQCPQDGVLAGSVEERRDLLASDSFRGDPLLYGELVRLSREGGNE